MGSGRGQKLGRSQKSRKGARGPGVLFADVAGVDEAKEELQEIVVSTQHGKEREQEEETQTA